MTRKSRLPHAINDESCEPTRSDVSLLDTPESFRTMLAHLNFCLRTRFMLISLRCAAVVLLLTGTAGHGWAIQSSAAAPVEATSFQRDVMAVLSKSGCNLGTCHGNQHGKGGLKLSLRGQDPEADFQTLTRQLGGRRTDSLTPDDSLLLLKPSMQVPHEGGRRFDQSSREYEILRSWIASGLPDDSASLSRLVELTVSPSHVTLHGDERTASLQATAHFEDGSQRDVTLLAVFE